MFKYVALAAATAVGALTLSAPAEAGHRDGHRYSKYDRDGGYGHRHHRHRRGGKLRIGVDDGGIYIYKKRKHRHHHHRRYD